MERDSETASLGTRAQSGDRRHTTLCALVCSFVLSSSFVVFFSGPVSGQCFVFLHRHPPAFVLLHHDCSVFHTLLFSVFLIVSSPSSCLLILSPLLSSSPILVPSAVSTLVPPFRPPSSIIVSQVFTSTFICNAHWTFVMLPSSSPLREGYHADQTQSFLSSPPSIRPL